MYYTHRQHIVHVLVYSSPAAIPKHTLTAVQVHVHGVILRIVKAGCDPVAIAQVVEH